MKRFRQLRMISIPLMSLAMPFAMAPVTYAAMQKAVLPPELEDAAKTLFAQGLADPTGGEYREVTIEVGYALDTVPTSVKTHAWVMPVGKDGKQRVVCWNGLAYEPLTVGEKTDLDKDIRGLLSTKNATPKIGPKARAHHKNSIASISA